MPLAVHPPSQANGLIYYWQPASVVSGSAPLASIAVFVIQDAEIIMALGAEVGGTQQPLLMRWCDAGEFTDWTATSTPMMLPEWCIPCLNETAQRIAGH
jgi:hypothetical protein